jgi:hypothetical protein
MDRKRSMRPQRNMYTNQYKDTTNRFNGIWHLLLIWKGSVFKLIWHDLGRHSQNYRNPEKVFLSHTLIISKFQTIPEGLTNYSRFLIHEKNTKE